MGVLMEQCILFTLSEHSVNIYIMTDLLIHFLACSFPGSFIAPMKK